MVLLSSKSNSAKSFCPHNQPPSSMQKVKVVEAKESTKSHSVGQVCSNFIQEGEPIGEPTMTEVNQRQQQKLKNLSFKSSTFNCLLSVGRTDSEAKKRRLYTYDGMVSQVVHENEQGWE